MQSSRWMVRECQKTDRFQLSDSSSAMCLMRCSLLQLSETLGFAGADSSTGNHQDSDSYRRQTDSEAAVAIPNGGDCGSAEWFPGKTSF